MLDQIYWLERVVAILKVKAQEKFTPLLPATKVIALPRL
jgi:hypothetical protein